MKKTVLGLFTAIFTAALAAAYNPPVQGENLYGFSHPELIAGGFSTAGGGILDVTPSTVINNPALGALENRVTLDLGYSAMFNNKGDDKYGQAFGTGILIPTAWCTITGEVEGIFVPFYNMHLGNSLNLKATASKQVAECLYLGAGLGGGAFWGYGSDWAITADVGAVFAPGDIAFMKNVRFGLSVLNLGKTYTNTEVWGIEKKKNEANFDGFPYFSTIRTGIAFELLHYEDFILGMSLDVTTPMFQNLIIDSGLQIEALKFIRFFTSWEYNARESGEDAASWIPTCGISFKFHINSKGDYMKRNGWQKSDIIPSVAWKNVHDDVNIISTGAVIRLGQPDEDAPVIEIGD